MHECTPRRHLAACMLLVTLQAGVAAAQAAGDTVVIHGARLVTMTESGIVEGRSVVVRSGIVAGILPDDAADVPGARTIDAGGNFLVPGLVDAHVHHRRHVAYGNYLAYGVTTVLGLGQGDELAEFLAVQAAIEGGTAGPRIYTTGHTIANHRHFDDPAEARAYVASLADDGRGFVKIYNGISRPVFDAVVAEARARGLGIFGHLPRNIPVEYTLAGGIDAVAHAEEFYFTWFGGPRDRDFDRFDASWTPDPDRSGPLLELMLDNDVALITTLSFAFDQMRFWQDPDAVLADPESAYLHADLQRSWRRSHIGRRGDAQKRVLRERIKYNLVHELTRRAQAVGVPVVAGTDTPLPGLFPGKALHSELRELIKSGLTPAEALAAATSNAGDLIARAVDPSARLGRIAEGYEADFVLVRENPLEDVRRLATIEAVMTDGRWYSRAELDALRTDIAAASR